MRCAGSAGVASVEQQSATPRSPLRFWNEAAEIGLDLVGVVRASPFQSPGDTADMCIDHDGRLTEDNAQNDVGRLPPHTRQCRQCRNRLRHLPVKAFDNPTGTTDDMFSFRPIETGRMDDRLQAGGIGHPEGFRCRRIPEQGGGDLIYPAVGTLGGEDCGNEELERGFVVQRGTRVWKTSLQTLERLGDLFDS